MFTRTLKTTAIALVAVIATAGASMAAQYAYVDHNAKVKFKPSTKSQTVNWIAEGQKVKIIGQNGNWVKIKIPGDDGWVKSGALSYDNWDNNPWPNKGYPNGSVCFNGQYGYVCLGN